MKPLQWLHAISTPVSGMVSGRPDSISHSSRGLDGRWEGVSGDWSGLSGDPRLQNCVKQTVATNRISWGKDICSEDHADADVVLES